MGTDEKKIWFPSDHLIIVDWQPVTHVLDRADDVAEMLTVAEIFPRQNKTNILEHARQVLGIDKSHVEFYKVSNDRTRL